MKIAKPKKKKIVIIGAGDNGFVVKNIFKLRGDCEVLGFLDDKQKGRHILGKLADYKKFHKKGYLFFISIADVGIRKDIFNKLKKQGVRWANAIHPRAFIEKGVAIGVIIEPTAYADRPDSPANK